MQQVSPRLIDADYANNFTIYHFSAWALEWKSSCPGKPVHAACGNPPWRCARSTCGTEFSHWGVATQLHGSGLHSRLYVLTQFIGLLLVMIGVHSVMAYNVSLQTHETGIRMALGAQRGDILRSVLRKGGILIAIGIGVFGAWGATRLIRNQLWHVKPTDPWSITGAILIVILTSVLACLIPARRAAEVDPLAALHHE